MQITPNFSLFVALIVVAVACTETGNEPAQNQQEPTHHAEHTDAKDYVEYHPNGMVKFRGKKVNGKREGLWVSFYEDGKKWSETTFRNGLKSGITRTYYENGMMRYSGEYTNDERSHIWKFYTEEGDLDRTVNMSEENADLP